MPDQRLSIRPDSGKSAVSCVNGALLAIRNVSKLTGGCAPWVGHGDGPRLMLRKRLCLLCLLLLPAITTAQTQSAPRQDTPGSLSGTWSAKASSGLALMGTWTAVPDPASGTVTGTWTLEDAQRRTVASGAWSAAKSPANWTGAWRAIITGRDGEYSGTWTAGVDLNPSAPFVELFRKAAQTVVSGTWRTGSLSGAWAIRTYEGT